MGSGASGILEIGWIGVPTALMAAAIAWRLIALEPRLVRTFRAFLRAEADRGLGRADWRPLSASDPTDPIAELGEAAGAETSISRALQRRILERDGYAPAS